MYSKSQNSGEPSFRIPDNYRGYAFGNESAKAELTDSAPKESLSSPQETDIQDATQASLVVPTADGEGRVSPLSSLLPPRPASPHGGLLGDIDWEELLILGILLLVWQSESDRDVLLLLALLLFYK